MKVSLMFGLVFCITAVYAQTPAHDGSESDEDVSREEIAHSQGVVENEQSSDENQLMQALAESLKEVAENTRPDTRAAEAAESREAESLRLATEDLDQQAAMAKFTRLIYLVSAVGVVASCIGVSLVAITLWFTKKAAQATERTLEIAKNQLQQNRAYMVHDAKHAFFSLETSLQTIKGEDGEQRQVRRVFGAQTMFSWINSGTSPALKVKVSASHALFPMDQITADMKGGHDWAPRFVPPSDYLDAVGNITVGQGQTTGASLFLDLNELLSISKNQSKLIIYMVIQYEDVWGSRYEAECTLAVSTAPDLGSWLGRNLTNEDLLRPPRVLHASGAVGSQNGEISLRIP